MNNIIYEDKDELIKSKEEYQNLITYLEQYISKLLRQPQIRMKPMLKVILKELRTKGYINNDKRFDIFRSLLMYEKFHKGTDIDKRVYDLRRFRNSNYIGSVLPLT